jgi:aminopeptidase N
VIAIPEYWPGAMEHPGAITFADGILLLDEKTRRRPSAA